MLRNYFSVAWRSIMKHKGYTAINIAGLSLSMSVCLLIILLTYDHFHYDNFHPQGDKVFRIVSRKIGQSGPFAEGYATSPLPLGRELMQEFPFAENLFQMNLGLFGEFRSEEKIVSFSAETDKRSFFASETFFSMTGFELASGNPDLALREPFSIVLTPHMQTVLFPNGDAMGSKVEIGSLGAYTVTGILAEPKGKSHIRFNALASASTMPLLANKGEFNKDFESWDNIWMNYNYVQLRDPDKREAAIAAINQLAQKHMKHEEDDPGYEFDLQPINAVVPGSLLSNEISFALPRLALLSFALLGITVIITATINYANLSVALTLTRIKEVAIRKTNGASRWQITMQFLLESCLISALALLVSIGIYKFLIARFNALWIFSMLDIQLEDTLFAYGYFVVFCLILGLLTGIAPSLFVSRLDTIRSLKGQVNAPTLKRSWISAVSGKKILLGVQFSLSILMIVSIFLLRDQIHALTSSDYGFDPQNVYYLKLQGHDTKVIQSEFGNISGVENMSFTSHHPGSGQSYAEDFYSASLAEPILVNYFGVDENYIGTLNLKLIAGSNFPHETNPEHEKYIILNRLATERLGFESPAAAIGNTIHKESESDLQIIGVVENYHWEPLMKSITPLALRILPETYDYVYLKTPPANMTTLASKTASTWAAFDDAREIKAGRLATAMDEFYLFMNDLGGILSFVSILALVITCLGLLGMISFELKMRTKEIGIRKVLGADFKRLALTIARGFLIMLGLSAVLAVPAAIILNGLWINAMEVHAPISIFNVGPGLLIIVMVAAVTLLSQIWINTHKNPTESLRSE